MPEPPTWPPPPNTPNLLAAHDDFLADRVRNSTLKTPLSRLRLIKVLHDKTKLDLRSCHVAVNNFCDRHEILIPLGGLWAWVGCLLPTIMLITIAAMTISWNILERRHDAALTHLERVTITAERIHISFISMGVYLTATCASVILAFWRAKKTREQAAEAKEKFA